MAAGLSNLFSTTPSTIDKIKDVNSTSNTITAFQTVLGAGAIAGATVNFDLESLVVNGSSDLGDCSSNSGNNTCTPANSPFTLTESPRSE